MNFPKELELCRYTYIQSFNKTINVCPAGKCCNRKNGNCSIDDKRCKTILYVKKD